MNKATFELIKDLINKHPAKSKSDLYEQLQNETRQRKLSSTGSISFETFTSIYSNQKRRQMYKSTTGQWKRLKDNAVKISEVYLSRTESKANAILQISNELQIYSPVLTARLILDGLNQQGLLELVDNIDEAKREKLNAASIASSLSSLIKQTELIKNGRLAREIQEACFADDDFGPAIDVVKNLIGVEYEIKLERILNEQGLSFVCEEELREKGFDKTPDFILDLPICLPDGTLICWIDSKATFGDEQSHSEYNENQFKCYLNRFGPGLVIYWFGYVTEVAQMPCNFSSSIRSHRLISIMDKFPSEFTKARLDDD